MYMYMLLKFATSRCGQKWRASPRSHEIEKNIRWPDANPTSSPACHEIKRASCKASAQATACAKSGDICKAFSENKPSGISIRKEICLMCKKIKSSLQSPADHQLLN
ncbi:hypothetical protein TWF225_008566 [Orbilia oligospora]|uniref:Uncharacterized protein n=1 Tax=Orbilia oligospora TaxID=2813651 RepID=A0A7C8PVE3_ORBOL|nr:hypothetical protein TWF225_008566 [Orbilia oligospora]KAF3180951.1 hypothetical protein TWF751_010164 [Orbilia oligospora]KAF3254358.1 hypothetical protein TWF128_006162 [Orbilia oligospora]KAF3255468.1 hypothetical protein TWF217_006635 [Orbilia oligospora]KAF3295773.1 hypothetical protein TWF132_001090 [Orbilia oligospora]